MSGSFSSRASLWNGWWNVTTLHAAGDPGELKAAA